jgi:hypothetical protein
MILIMHMGKEWHQKEILNQDQFFAGKAKVRFLRLNPKNKYITRMIKGIHLYKFSQKKRIGILVDAFSGFEN